MSLLFDMLSRFVKAFLPHGLITSQRPHFLLSHWRLQLQYMSLGKTHVFGHGSLPHRPLCVLPSMAAAQVGWRQQEGGTQPRSSSPGLSSRTVRLITWLLRAPRGRNRNLQAFQSLAWNWQSIATILDYREHQPSPNQREGTETS